METSKFTRCPGDVTTEDLIALATTEPFLVEELVKGQYNAVDRNLNLLYPCVNVGQLEHELPIVKGVPIYRVLTNEEFDSIYEFGKYSLGRAWVLEAFNLTGEVTSLDDIYQHLYRRAAPAGFKRNPDYEERHDVYPD